MSSDGENVDTNIKVAVRCRPLNSKERANGEQICVKVFPDQIVLTNPENKTDEHSFGFDLVFPEDVTQEDVWNKVGLPILNKAISGYNSTIFAYGQTGSGKTWSMQGAEGDMQGIIPRMNSSLFERIAEERNTRPSIQFLVTVSYFEIYNEVIFDLLDPTDRKKRSSKGGLEIKEHPALGVYVKGLQEIVVDHASKLSSIVDQGMGNRTVASTQMNADSSRSHSVFMITVHQKDADDPSKNIFAKINLVDLAGSERVKSTGATGATLKEGANINKSLSSLGNVINALVEAGKGKAVFIPYRNSKLTRVLQESLGGNSVTSMLAAMSPAACNFDETLSTLKYANRAKAIKVKAVKNEEASAVSRLNEEIRMLKEKLVAQGSQGSGEAPSGMSEKNKQQLKELEEAVRNTWDAKTKMSQEHEQERRRLLQEQQLAAQQLQSAKERSWTLLEQKGLVELTISHLKELAKSEVSVSAEAESWSERLQRLSGLEKSAAEQLTVVQILRASVEKDIAHIAKTSCVNVKDGKRVDGALLLNALSQLKEKVSSTQDETARWCATQRTLDGEMNALVAAVQAFSSAFKDVDAAQDAQSPADKQEIVRCLGLFLKQLFDKELASRETWRAAQLQLCEVAFLSRDLSTVAHSCAEAASEGVFADATNAAAQDIKRALNQIHDALQSAQKQLVCSPSNNAAPEEAPMNLPCTVRGTNFAPHKAVPSGHCFVFSPCTASPTETDLCVRLHEMSTVRCVRISGCRFHGTKSQQTADCESTLAESRLPCGLSLSECSGDIETTTSALGDVLDWSALLKKNPPEKFLRRPPVRFLFDLFKHLAELFPGALPPQIENADWAVVGATKESKTEFMDDMVRFVAQKTNCEPVTSGAAIITGSDPELTNKMLQQLALAVFPQRRSAHDSDEVGREREVKVLCSAFLKAMRVQLFADHDEPMSWQGRIACASTAAADERSVNGDEVIRTLLSSHEDVAELFFTGEQHCLSLSITAVEWSNDEFPDFPALRVEVLGFNAATARQKLPQAFEDAQLMRGLSDADASLSALQAVVAKMNNLEQAEKARRQDELKKHMELMAQEKAALAQALASEKDALMSNNQDLTDQLQKCFKQLQETAALLEKEQQINLQLEKNRVALEEDQSSLQQKLAEREQENSQLRSALAKTETALEKERASVAELVRALNEKRDQVESLQLDLQYAIKSRDVLEQERDELQHQVVVLVEERDAARGHEEELFEKLTDVTNDLERLQESYVDIADRCNDAQDEASELRDQVQALQESLALQRSAFTAERAAIAAQPMLHADENLSSEPKTALIDIISQAQAHKRSAKNVSMPPVSKNSSSRSMEHNRVFDGENEIFVSVDDSKHPSSRQLVAEHVSIQSAKSKNADDDYYQEDFDDYQDEE